MGWQAKAIERLGPVVAKDQEGPERAVKQVKYGAPNFDTGCANAIVALECGHEHVVELTKERARILPKYFCQACRT